MFDSKVEESKPWIPLTPFEIYEILKNVNCQWWRVPFEFAAKLNGKSQVVDVAKLQCPHANIGEAKDQPKLMWK